MRREHSFPTSSSVRSSRGYTLIELLVVIAIISILISIILPGLGKARLSARILKDSVHIRASIQAMHTWGLNDKDNYPLPSRIDLRHLTCQPIDDAIEKDNTGNIFSVLIFNGFVSPSAMVSPAELNSAIVVDTGYEYKLPVYANNPEGALWDPGFAGLPGEIPINGYTTGLGSQQARRTGAGNTSYAHSPAFGPRKAWWRTTGSSREPVMSSRGPTYEGAPGAWTVEAGTLGRDSNRLKMFGTTDRWTGNVGFNDAHVKFENRPDPESVSFAFESAGQRLQFNDNLFVNEDERNDGLPDFENIPTNGTNALLQIFGNVSTRGPYIEGKKDVYLNVFKD